MASLFVFSGGLILFSYNGYSCILLVTKGNRGDKPFSCLAGGLILVCYNGYNGNSYNPLVTRGNRGDKPFSF